MFIHNFITKTFASIFIFPVSNYLLGGEIHTREYVAPEIKENGPVDNYGFAEQQLQQVAEAENIMEDNSADQSNGSVQNTVNPLQDPLPPSVEEPVGETQKHTYASIVRSKPLQLLNDTGLPLCIRYSYANSFAQSHVLIFSVLFLLEVACC